MTHKRMCTLRMTFGLTLHIPAVDVTQDALLYLVFEGTEMACWMGPEGGSSPYTVLFFFFFGLACEILVSPPRIKPGPCSEDGESLNPLDHQAHLKSPDRLFGLVPKIKKKEKT